MADAHEQRGARLKLDAERMTRCPECGELGERAAYDNGDAMVKHEMRRGPFGFREVTRSCYFGAGSESARVLHEEADHG